MALCHVVHNDATYYKTIATPTHYINPLPATTVDAPRLDYIVAISACAAHDDGPLPIAAAAAALRCCC